MASVPRHRQQQLSLPCDHAITQKLDGVHKQSQPSLSLSIYKTIFIGGRVALRLFSLQQDRREEVLPPLTVHISEANTV